MANGALQRLEREVVPGEEHTVRGLIEILKASRMKDQYGRVVRILMTPDPHQLMRWLERRPGWKKSGRTKSKRVLWVFNPKER